MISKYFTETMVVSRNVTAKVGGVNKKTPTEIGTTLVAIDKIQSSNTYNNDIETYNFSNVIIAPYGTDIIEDDLAVIDGIRYNVGSVIDPMKRHHHLEILVDKQA